MNVRNTESDMCISADLEGLFSAKYYNNIYDSSKKFEMCMAFFFLVRNLNYDQNIVFFFNSHFGFYNSNETVVEMKQQDVRESKMFLIKSFIWS